MDKALRCRMCHVGLPVAKAHVGRLAAAGAGAAIGGAATKTLWGALLLAGVGYLAGSIVEGVAQPICGDCTTRW